MFQLLAGRGVGVISVVVQLNQLLGVERQALDVALAQALHHSLYPVFQLGFGFLQIGLVDHDMLFFGVEQANQPR